MTVALGREERVFVVPESTFGVAASAPASGNALKVLECGFTPAEERVIRADKRNTRSPLEFIRKRVSATWNIKSYLLPSGTLGVAPDGMDDIFEACFGTETINVGTSVVYSLAKEVQNSLTFHRAIGQSAPYSVFSEMYRGSVVDKLTFDLSGQEPAMVSMEGMAADMLRAGSSLITADDGSIVGVTTGDGGKYDAGQYVDVDSETDLLISSVSGDNLTVAAHTAQTIGERVIPSACVKAQTFQSLASPISGILGASSLDSAGFDILTAQIVLGNNLKMHNDKYGTNKASSYHANNRLVTGQLTIRLTDSNFLRVAKTRNTVTADLQLISGTTSGLIATFDLNQVVFDVTAIQAGAEEDVLVTLPFTALGSSGEDELTLTLT